MNKTRENLVQSLIEQIGSVIRGMHRNRGFSFGDFMLGWPQVRILFFVAKRKDGVPVKDLAAFFNVTPGAVTQFVDALVEKDLVRREEDQNDRRILRVMLTEFAENEFDRFRESYLTSMSRSFDSLSDGEIEQLISLLAKIDMPSGAKECLK